MPTEKEVFSSHAREYEALVSHEDYQGNLLKAIQEIAVLEESVVLDLGAGTGRFAFMLGPHVRRILAFDISPNMLGVARDKLISLAQDNWLVAASDHRRLPIPSSGADLIISGWSVSYLAVWRPDRWRGEAESWLTEARRVLKKGGTMILFESLGTGNELPQRLVHLEHFCGWLKETGFRNRWIRTDYQFESPKVASEVAGFFFGKQMRDYILQQNMTILPECAGIWWLNI